MTAVEETEVLELDENEISTGEKKRRNRINRSAPLYLRKSVTRLSIIANRPLKTKADICAALEEYGYCLLPEQREALEKHCGLT